MRAFLFPLMMVCGALLAACDGTSSTSSASGGGGSGGSASGGGGSSTTSMGGGGSSMTTSTSTDVTSTTTGMMTTTSTGSGPTDPCETAGTDPVFFANEVEPIFTQSCGDAVSCHLKSLPSAGLSLKPGEVYANLVGVPASQNCNGQMRVAPGSAVDSYVVNKLNNTDICPMTKKMPPSATLPAASKQKIIDWICQGAQNN